MSHIVILPYFSDDEVRRYVMIAEHLRKYPHPKVPWRFLLAASACIQPSTTLRHAYEEVGDVSELHCSTQVFGYPHGATAMFWDVMDYIAARHGDEQGFALWLESDMVPVQPDWLDRLSDEWYVGARPLVMGLPVPNVSIRRWGKLTRIPAHINGGACYAKDLARQMPVEARSGTFDIAIYPHCLRRSGVRATRLIAFSHNQRVRRDLQSPQKVLLHGYKQHKDEFLRRCLAPITAHERRLLRYHTSFDRLEQIQRRVRLWLMPRGRRALYHNTLAEIDRLRNRASGCMS